VTTPGDDDQAAALANLDAAARAVADAKREMDRIGDELDSTVAALLASGAPPAAVLDRVLALLGEAQDSPTLRWLFRDGPPAVKVLERFVPDHPPTA
jgi:hypothetical protein